MKLGFSFEIVSEEAMKVLFIGGTGVISSACSPLAIERGIELFLLNRGQTERPIPNGAIPIKADIRDPDSVRKAISGQKYDVIVDWVAFTPEHVQTDIDLFKGITGQYVFISTAAAYHPSSLPITESTLLANPHWDYAYQKILCERRLFDAYIQEDFPATIVRPSHTYDQTMLPLQYRYTVIDRMRKGQNVVVHGDGTSLWVLTNHRDFAKGLVGLLGNSRAIGEAVHITSDEILTWNQIFGIVADAAGGEFKPMYAPSNLIAKIDPEWGSRLMGDKAISKFFDNTKIKRLVPDFAATVPFYQGAREIISWFDADPERKSIDMRANAIFNRIIATCERALEVDTVE
jgi:nucleoside-diphosphate-sugar epimerase